MDILTTIALADLLLKSTVLLGAFLLLDLLIGRRLNSNSRHLLWLNALFCVAVLPFLPMLVSYAAPGTVASDAWFEITVTPASVAAATPGTFNVSWLLIFYAIPACWLLTKMGTALYGLRRLRQRSAPVTNNSTITLLADLKTQLDISRKIELRLGRDIDSPLSFGLLTPHIILPEQSKNWSASVMTDVLLHELSHIKRLDWITLITAWLIATVFCLLVQAFALKRLNEEAEHSCDTAVLHAGRSDTDYAGSLLSVAQACIHSAQITRAEKLSAQMMLDRNTLKTRIHRILEDNIMSTPERKQLVKKELKRTAALLVLISSATLGLFGTSHLLSAQTPDPTRAPDPSQRTVDQEMIPLHSEMPQYPRAAADGGIEGWVQVRFTVTAAGTVDADSVEVVDAEPADIFNASAQRATLKFEFSPRIRNGVPVDVPNVQYVFRYRLQEDPAQETTP